MNIREERAIMKKYLLPLIVIICIAIFIFSIMKISVKPDTTVVTSLSIQDITDKSHIDNYYLKILLDDFVVQEYGLSYNSLTLKTTESIYNKVKVNSGFAGVSLKIVIPGSEEKRDLGMILKENLIDWCEVIGITTKDNAIID